MKQFLKSLDTALSGIVDATGALLDDPILYNALGAETIRALMRARNDIFTTRLITEKFMYSNVNNPAILSAIAEYEADFIQDKNEPTAAAKPAPLQDTAPAPKGAHKPATEPAEPIAVQAETAPTAAPAPAPTPEKELTPEATANGEKTAKKSAPKATPPVSKSAEQTAPKAQGWIEKPKSDDKLNSASQENYADKSDADLDKERRLLCRDAVLKGAQPEAVRNFTIEKFGVRTVGAIPREKHGEWVRAFKETFGV